MRQARQTIDSTKPYERNERMDAFCSGATSIYSCWQINKRASAGRKNTHFDIHGGVLSRGDEGDCHSPKR